jgi:hypothetical protein
MLRIAICSGALIAVIAAVRLALNGAFDSWGIGWGLAVCAVVMGATFMAAYLYDRASTRSQAEQPPKPHDYR